jgi:hypothetical protein
MPLFINTHRSVHGFHVGLGRYDGLFRVDHAALSW